MRIVMLALIGSITLLHVSSWRMAQSNIWLPSLPEKIDGRSASLHDVDGTTLALLGNPHGRSATYSNGKGMDIEITMVTGAMFENYHDPTACVGKGEFALVDSRAVDIGSGMDVRRLSFVHRLDPTIKMIMYYWQQRQSGTLDYRSRMGYFKDFIARVSFGWCSLMYDDPTIILRTYCLYKDIVGNTDLEGPLKNVSVGLIGSLRNRQ